MLASFRQAAFRPSSTKFSQLSKCLNPSRHFYSTEAPVDTPPVPPKGAYTPPRAALNPFSETDKYDTSKYTRIRPKYRLHCHSSRNNTINTFTDEKGNTRAWFSGGSCGFKRVNRSSYEAGYQCAVRVFEAVKKAEEDYRKTHGVPAGMRAFDLEVFFKGFGNGREALQKALQSSEGDVVRPWVITTTDRTPIKIGGTRAKKQRRL